MLKTINLMNFISSFIEFYKEFSFEFYPKLINILEN